MRADLNYPSPQAIWLREKTPGPLLIISVIGLPVVSIMLFGAIETKSIEGIFITLVGGFLPWLFLYTNSTGLKLAWDEQRVYMRPQSFRPPSWRRPWLARLPWRSLAYDEIVSLDALTINDPAAKSFLLPFQLLRLTAPGTIDDFDERHIWLYSLALRDKELAPLLRQLQIKCPGMLPAVVQKRLARCADNDW